MIIFPESIDVAEDRSLSVTTTGAITVYEGATLVHSGIHNGSISVKSGAAVIIEGSHNGSLRIEPDGYATVSGSQMGSVHVERRGMFSLTSTGRHGGSIHNDGVYVNEGLRGGTVHGIPPTDRLGGRVKQPDKIVDGNSYYSF